MELWLVLSDLRQRKAAMSRLNRARPIGPFLATTFRDRIGAVREPQHPQSILVCVCG